MRLCRRAAIWTDRKLSDGFTAVTTVVNTPAEAVVVLLGCRCKLSLGAGKISVDGSLKLSLGACGAQRCIRRRTMLRSFLVHNRSSSTPGQASLLVAVDEDRIWHSPASAIPAAVQMLSDVRQQMQLPRAQACDYCVGHDLLCSRWHPS
jgi:hypothetical protein